MYQMNDIEMMREHRQALLAEAEGARLTRWLKDVRPKREEPYSGKMRRRAMREHRNGATPSRSGGSR